MKGLARAASFSLVLLTALLVLSWAVAARASDSRLPKAPEFSAKDLNGKTIKLSELLKEGPVFIDFWTTWCKPCKLELPELDRLDRTYREYGFRVVAISQDDSKTVRKVKPYVRQRKFEMLVLIDPKLEIGSAYNVRNYPTSFLVNMKGEIVHFAQGYSRGDEKALEKQIRGLLGLPEEGSTEEEAR